MHIHLQTLQDVWITLLWLLSWYHLCKWEKNWRGNNLKKHGCNPLEEEKKKRNENEREKKILQHHVERVCICTSSDIASCLFFYLVFISFLYIQRTIKYLSYTKKMCIHTIIMLSRYSIYLFFYHRLRVLFLPFFLFFFQMIV